MNATELQEATRRWQECPECRAGDPINGECSKCGSPGNLHHSYVMMIMAMCLPARELHVAAHETLMGKRLCAHCVCEHYRKTIQTLWFDRQPQPEPNG